MDSNIAPSYSDGGVALALGTAPFASFCNIDPAIDAKAGGAGGGSGGGGSSGLPRKTLIRGQFSGLCASEETQRQNPERFETFSLTPLPLRLPIPATTANDSNSTIVAVDCFNVNPCFLDEVVADEDGPNGGAANTLGASITASREQQRNTTNASSSSDSRGNGADSAAHPRPLRGGPVLLQIEPFSRSAAGKIIDPGYLRTPAALEKSMHFLVQYYLRSPHTPLCFTDPNRVWGYLWDRLRGIRTTWGPQLPLCSAGFLSYSSETDGRPLASQQLEKESRRRMQWLEFTVAALAVAAVYLCRTVEGCRAFTREKKNFLESISQCFTDLTVWYRSEQRTRHAEFFSLLLLLYGLNQESKVEDRASFCHFNDVGTSDGSTVRVPEPVADSVNLSQVYRELEKQPHMAQTQPVMAAVKLINSWAAGRWFEFFHLCRHEPLTPLQRAFLFQSFTYARFRCVLDLAVPTNPAYGKMRWHDGLPLASLADLLMMQGPSHCAQFLATMGLGECIDYSGGTGEGRFLTSQGRTLPIVTVAQIEERCTDKSQLVFPTHASFFGLRVWQEAFLLFRGERLCGGDAAAIAQLQAATRRLRDLQRQRAAAMSSTAIKRAPHRISNNGSNIGAEIAAASSAVASLEMALLQTPSCPVNLMEILEPYCPPYNTEVAAVAMCDVPLPDAVVFGSIQRHREAMLLRCLRRSNSDSDDHDDAAATALLLAPAEGLEGVTSGVLDATATTVTTITATTTTTEVGGEGRLRAKVAEAAAELLDDYDEESVATEEDLYLDCSGAGDSSGCHYHHRGFVDWSDDDDAKGEAATGEGEDGDGKENEDLDDNEETNLPASIKGAHELLSSLRLDASYIRVGAELKADDEEAERRRGEKERQLAVLKEQLRKQQQQQQQQQQEEEGGVEEGEGDAAPSAGAAPAPALALPFLGHTVVTQLRDDHQPGDASGPPTPLVDTAATVETPKMATLPLLRLFGEPAAAGTFPAFTSAVPRGDDNIEDVSQLVPPRLPGRHTDDDEGNSAVPPSSSQTPAFLSPAGSALLRGATAVRQQQQQQQQPSVPGERPPTHNAADDAPLFSDGSFSNGGADDAAAEFQIILSPPCGQLQQQQRVDFSHTKAPPPQQKRPRRNDDDDDNEGRQAVVGTIGFAARRAAIRRAFLSSSAAPLSAMNITSGNTARRAPTTTTSSESLLAVQQQQQQYSSFFACGFASLVGDYLSAAARLLSGRAQTHRALRYAQLCAAMPPDSLAEWRRGLFYGPRIALPPSDVTKSKNSTQWKLKLPSAAKSRFFSADISANNISSNASGVRQWKGSRVLQEEDAIAQRMCVGFTPVTGTDGGGGHRTMPPPSSAVEAPLKRARREGPLTSTHNSTIKYNHHRRGRSGAATAGGGGGGGGGSLSRAWSGIERTMGQGPDAAAARSLRNPGLTVDTLDETVLQAIAGAAAATTSTNDVLAALHRFGAKTAQSLGGGGWGGGHDGIYHGAAATAGATAIASGGSSRGSSQVIQANFALVRTDPPTTTTGTTAAAHGGAARPPCPDAVVMARAFRHPFEHAVAVALTGVGIGGTHQRYGANDTFFLAPSSAAARTSMTAQQTSTRAFSAAMMMPLAQAVDSRAFTFLTTPSPTAPASQLHTAWLDTRVALFALDGAALEATPLGGGTHAPATSSSCDDDDGSGGALAGLCPQVTAIVCLDALTHPVTGNDGDGTAIYDPTQWSRGLAAIKAVVRAAAAAEADTVRFSQQQPSSSSSLSSVEEVSDGPSPTRVPGLLVLVQLPNTAANTTTTTAAAALSRVCATVSKAVEASWLDARHQLGCDKNAHANNNDSGGSSSAVGESLNWRRTINSGGSSGKWALRSLTGKLLRSAAGHATDSNTSNTRATEQPPRKQHQHQHQQQQSASDSPLLPSACPLSIAVMPVYTAVGHDGNAANDSGSNVTEEVQRSMMEGAYTLLRAYQHRVAVAVTAAAGNDCSGSGGAAGGGGTDDEGDEEGGGGNSGTEAGGTLGGNGWSNGSPTATATCGVGGVVGSGGYVHDTGGYWGGGGSPSAVSLVSRDGTQWGELNTQA